MSRYGGRGYYGGGGGRGYYGPPGYYGGGLLSGLLGGGYYGGILPYRRPYYPLLAPLPYYGYNGSGAMCSYPRCPEKATLKCPTCGRLHCAYHAQTDSHMYAQTADYAAQVASEHKTGAADAGGDDVGCSVEPCCFTCGTNAPKYRCGRCKCVAYCSQGCQDNDWRRGHANVCRALAITLLPDAACGHT